MYILIVDARPSISKELGAYLGELGYHTDYAYSASHAVSIFDSDHFDAVVIAAKLPGIGGIGLTECLRRSFNGDVPILMLGCEEGVDNVVLGLNSGADVYLNPGYDVREVELRLRAMHARRYRSVRSGIHVGELVYDDHTKQAWRRGCLLRLPMTQLNLLRMLMAASPRIVSHRSLKSCLRTENPHRCLLRTHISKLRRCINRGFDERLAISGEASGYRLRLHE